jgi:hypothetical protein
MNPSGAARLCRARMQSLGAGPDAASLADIVWLALQLSLRGAGGDGDAPSVREGQSSSAPGVARDSVPETTPALTAPPAPDKSSDELVQLYPSHRTNELGIAPASFVNVPGGEPLPGRQRLERALKPFKRRLPSRHRCMLDPVATAEVSAERRAVTPIYRPAPERWFDVALLAEASDAMHVWDADLIELRRMLSRHGAFRRVRLWRYSVKKNALVLACATGGATAAAASPRVLVDPEGRRLCLFLTTGTSLLWRHAALTALVAAVGRCGPVAVVQLMPREHWAYTLLGDADEEVLSRAPGTPIARLDIRNVFTGDIQRVSDAWTVPMTSLEPARLAAWSRFAMTNRRTWHPAVRIGPSAEGSPPLRHSPATDNSPNERIAAFRDIASPEAYRLLRLLSGMPLSLPVMRLMQVGMPNRSLVQLAEVLLSGLIERVTPLASDVPPDQVEYDFAAGIREELRDSLSLQEGDRIDASLADITRQAERFIEEHVGNVDGSFVAMVADPAGKERLLQGARSFLRVARGLSRQSSYATPSPSVARSPSITFPEAPLPPSVFSFLSEADIQGYVLRTEPLLQGGGSLRALLFFATDKQHSWLVASNHAVAFVLDDENTQREDALVQRVSGWMDALPVEAEFQRNNLLRMGGPETRAWYCSPNRFRSEADLEDAATALAPGGKQGTLASLRALALNYEDLRKKQKPGPARTMAMTDVVDRMVRLPPLSEPDLTLATRSESFGNHLVAVATLKRQYDPAHEDWLFSRITGPQAFLAFHAAIAVHEGIEAMGQADRRRVHEKVVATKHSLLEAKLDDRGVMEVLGEIEEATQMGASGGPRQRLELRVLLWTVGQDVRDFSAPTVASLVELGCHVTSYPQLSRIDEGERRNALLTSCDVLVLLVGNADIPASTNAPDEFLEGSAAEAGCRDAARLGIPILPLFYDRGPPPRLRQDESSGTAALRRLIRQDRLVATFHDARELRDVLFRAMISLSATRRRAESPLMQVLVCGTGNRTAARLPDRVRDACATIGTQLAQFDFGLVTGGWRGVDELVARHFAAGLATQKGLVEERLTTVAAEGDTPAFEIGQIVRYQEELTYSQLVSRADAVVLIGGAGGAGETARVALLAGLPVLPLGHTGGDAKSLHSRLQSEAQASDMRAFAKADPPERPRILSVADVEALGSPEGASAAIEILRRLRETRG